MSQQEPPLVNFEDKDISSPQIGDDTLHDEDTLAQRHQKTLLQDSIPVSVPIETKVSWIILSLLYYNFRNFLEHKSISG